MTVLVLLSGDLGGCQGCLQIFACFVIHQKINELDLRRDETKMSMFSIILSCHSMPENATICDNLSNFLLSPGATRAILCLRSQTGCSRSFLKMFPAILIEKKYDFPVRCLVEFIVHVSA